MAKIPTLFVLTALIAACVAGEQPATLPVTADVGICNYVGKERLSNGAGPSTPIRQNQNWQGFENRTLLLDVDPAAVRGWEITGAVLHLYLAKGELFGVGLSEVLAPWQEPATLNWQDGEGAPSWLFARNPRSGAAPGAGEWWAWPGSSLASVSFAHPAARFSHAGPGRIGRERVASPPDATRPLAEQRFLHLTVPVDPLLVAARAAGLNHGFVLCDDKGQVAESRALLGPGYPYLDSDAEDIWLFTREVQDPALRPRLEVFGAPARPDRPAPAVVADLAATVAADAVVLGFTAPGDAEGRDLLAYEVAALPGGQDATGKAWEQATLLPRWQIARPAKAGTHQALPLWQLPHARNLLLIRGVDRTGRRSAVASLQVDAPASQGRSLPTPPPATPAQPAPATDPARPFTLHAVPDLVKVDPISGALQTSGKQWQLDAKYLDANPAYAGGTVALTAAANETVAFQVVVESRVETPQRLGLRFTDLVGPAGQSIAARPNLQGFRVWYVRPAADAKTPAPFWQGDACLPLASPFAETFELPAVDNAVPGQRFQALWVDLFIPKGTKAGRYIGSLAVEGGNGAVGKLPLRIDVLPLALPDQPTWSVELNCYGGLAGFVGVAGDDPGAAESEWTFYRLAKAHRLMINALPYGQRGKVDAARAPVVEGDGAKLRVSDWSAFDRRYGPLLDGSAFTAAQGYLVGPGAGTPISHVYLPFHENWPVPLEKAYADFARLESRLDFAAWAERSRLLPETYAAEAQEGYAAVARQFAEHAAERKWLGTTFQFFLNNKYYYKVPFFSETGSGRYGSSFWLLDEPIDHDDYAANAFFLGLCRRGVEAAKTPVRFAYRADVSQPEMTRGLWDGAVDLWMSGFSAVNSGFSTTAMARQRWLPGERTWHYGGGTGVAEGFLGIAQAVLASWAAGSDGMLPFWTTLGGKDWSKADDLAIYYTGKGRTAAGSDHPAPLPGVRMKILRRCQQDIELLQRLASSPAERRRLLESFADDRDAPVLLFTKLSLGRLHELRTALLAGLANAPARP